MPLSTRFAVRAPQSRGMELCCRRPVVALCRQRQHAPIGFAVVTEARFAVARARDDERLEVHAVALGDLDRTRCAASREPLCHAANQRLANHLLHEQPHLFTFLYCPGVPATNNFIEAAIRPMVVARKTWGGNRTWNGARTQQILASALRTCWQQGKDAFQQFVTLLRSKEPMLLNLVPASLSP